MIDTALTVFMLLCVSAMFVWVAIWYRNWRRQRKIAKWFIAKFKAEFRQINANLDRGILLNDSEMSGLYTLKRRIEKELELARDIKDAFPKRVNGRPKP